jgi:glycerol-3-phosphate dehydrogenase
VTRDYKLVTDDSFGPRIVSVFGGKITTYRRLACEAMEEITGKKSEWTGETPLPGGDMTDFAAFAAEQKRKYDYLPAALVERCARSYGTRMDRFLGPAMGTHYGDHVYAAEIDYLVRNEWARSAGDILWRRSKLGLHVSKQTAYNLESAFG